MGDCFEKLPGSQTSYTLNSLEAGYIGDYYSIGISIGAIKGDTRRLDCSSNGIATWRSLTGLSQALSRVIKKLKL